MTIINQNSVNTKTSGGLSIQDSTKHQIHAEVYFSLHCVLQMLTSSISCVVICIISIFLFSFLYLGNPPDSYLEMSDFEGFNNETGVKSFIVPNIVHFIRFNKSEYDFIEAICVLAAVKNQKPDKLYIHTNLNNFTGIYWDYLLRNKEFNKIYEIKYLEMPTEIFGQKLQRAWLYYHASDVARIRILMEYGGIYLDGDSYVVQSLDRYRHFEMSLAWDENDILGSQTLIAHKNARFLHYWLESYRGTYDASKWYYNAGELPTQSLLIPNPHLIHRVKLYLGAHIACGYRIYSYDWPEWRFNHAIHMLINHRKDIDPNYKNLLKFDHVNVINHPYSVGDMAREILKWHNF